MERPMFPVSILLADILERQRPLGTRRDLTDRLGFGEQDRGEGLRHSPCLPCPLLR